MNTIRSSILLIVIAASVTMPARAGTVAGFGGSTELTQLANNAQLAASYVEQVQTALNSARQYQLMLDQLKRNPAGFADSMLGGELNDHLQNADNTARLIARLESVSNRKRGIIDEMNRAHASLEYLEGQGIRMTPPEYYDGMAALARERGGIYQERANQFHENVKGAQSDIEQINLIASQSEGITTEIQGLQSVVASQGVVSTLLLRQVEMMAATGAEQAAQAARMELSHADAIEHQKKIDAEWADLMQRRFGVAPQNNGD